MLTRHRLMIGSLFVSTVTLLAGLAASPAGAGSTNVLYVSPGGSDANPCTKTQPCQTIQHAVSVANDGDVVSVGPGTYHEGVRIDKAITVRGESRPLVDATGIDNGFFVNGPGAAGAAVKGFTVENATLEGILVLHTSGVQIRSNQVIHNDQGMFSPDPVGECAPSGEIPGDCGEGIHLMSVTGATVAGNTSSDNSGGILLSDEFGPTASNLVTGNDVEGNAYDCGITVAGHNDQAVVDGEPQPDVAGIYGNTISGNTSNGNGVLGDGAGILLATAGPGTAVYDNTIVGNTARGNSLAGITLHSHAPGDFLNGNVIESNRLVHDNIGGDPDANDFQTTGILVFSAVQTLTGTVVRSNTLVNEYYGIWTQNVPNIPASANTYLNVTVPVFQQ